MIKRRSGRTLGLAAAVTVALVACGGNAFGPTPRDAEFAASLGIDLDAMTETASGLFYVDEVVGTGSAAATGDVVTVAYTGWLPDGEVFDSSPGFTFQIGEPGIIDGFSEGVTGMQIGGGADDRRVPGAGVWLGGAPKRTRGCGHGLQADPHGA